MLSLHRNTSRPRNAGDRLATIRTEEFAPLDQQGLCYLDYTGAALPSRSQLAEHARVIGSTIWGNPHSEHAPSRRSTEAIEYGRERLLKFLDADPADYEVCFTANATAAIKLVAESFPFRRQSTLALTADNHNSVNGIREYARRAGARLLTLPMDRALRLSDPAA